jgi:hypothetical protein
MPGRSFEKYELIERVLAHGRFVLHGSNADDLRWLAPQPPAGFGRGRGPTGVYATEDVASAIFYAIVNRKAARWVSANPGRFYLEPLEGATATWVPGAVYVLDRDDFEVVNGSLVSPTAVKAVGKVAVRVDDFPLLDQVQRTTREAWLAARS